VRLRSEIARNRVDDRHYTNRPLTKHIEIIVISYFVQERRIEGEKKGAPIGGN